jgi:hypothetical protein
VNLTQTAAARIRYYALTDDADKRTSMADSRIALAVARGVAMDDIDPASGYDYSRNAYATVRASWVLFLRDNGWSEFHDKQGRTDPESTVAKWAEHRPEFLAGDDWLAAGIAAHRDRHTGPTCFRNGRCDFHPDADHAELMRLIAEDNAKAVTNLGPGVQDSLFDNLAA